MALLKTENISVSFNENRILDNVSIHLNEGEIVSLMGVSGCGKSTLFNVIAGILSPDEGRVLLKDDDVTGTSGLISYMLQKDLLLPYKTILDNVSLPLLLKGMNKSDARNTALSLFDEFGLSGTHKQYPNELSGGMRQRAAFLRTYLFSNEVALLDEPFSALDALTKSVMHRWYLNIIKQISLSTLLITHDVDEAILLSDRIYILAGKPATIVKEVQIAPCDIRRPDLLVSESFLDYKKEIISAIGDNIK